MKTIAALALAAMAATLSAPAAAQFAKAEEATRGRKGPGHAKTGLTRHTATGPQGGSPPHDKGNLP